MKILFAFILLFFTYGKISAHGTQWFQCDNDDYWQVLNEAQRQQKVACFYLYVDWSQQCEILNEQVWQNSQVGDFYNRNFINHRVNVGEGEGRQLIKDYRVRGVPALVFIKPDGQLVRITNNKGLVSSEAVLKAGRLALNYPGEKEWGYYLERYESGDRSWQFLEKYINERVIETSLPPPYDLVHEYVSALPERQLMHNERVRYMLYHYAYPDNELYHILVRNQEDLLELRDTQKSIHIFSTILKYNQVKSPYSIDDYKRKLKRDFGKRCYPALEYMELMHQIQSNNATAFVDDYFMFMQKYKLSPVLNHDVLVAVLQGQAVKPEHIHLLMNELNSIMVGQGQQLLMNAVLVRLMILAGDPQEAVMYAQNILLDRELYPYDRRDEQSLNYLQRVADGHTNKSFAGLLRYLQKY